MNTGERNRHGRVIYQGTRGGRYVMVGTRKQYVSAPSASSGGGGSSAPAPAPAANAGFKRVTINGQEWLVNKDGRIRKPNMSRHDLRWNQVESILKAVVRRHPGHLNQKHMPFASRTLNVNQPHSSSIRRTNVFVDSANQATRNARVYFNPTTEQLMYRRPNGSFVNATSNQVPHGLRLFPGGRARVLAEVRIMMMSPGINEFGTFLGSPASLPRPTLHTNANLLNNITGQIFTRGNINTSRYTSEQKARLSTLLKNKIQSLREKYKKEKKEGKSEMEYGYTRNQARAFMRGYAAINPLSGKVKSPRIYENTPNRGTPGVKTNIVSLENLQKPHLVIKQRGVRTVYVNPNSLINLIKTGSGANIQKNDLRHWLRQMRRNMPNQPLFPNPESRDKYVKVKHIRFSKS